MAACGQHCIPRHSVNQTSIDLRHTARQQLMPIPAQLRQMSAVLSFMNAAPDTEPPVYSCISQCTIQTIRPSCPGILLVAFITLISHTCTHLGMLVS
jgi:hypothetical protein